MKKPELPEVWLRDGCRDPPLLQPVAHALLSEGRSEGPYGGVPEEKLWDRPAAGIPPVTPANIYPAWWTVCDFSKSQPFPICS